VREVKARLRRFGTWTPFAAFPVVANYKSGFIDGTHTVEKIQGIIDRHTTLVSGLKAAGLSLREDSRLCNAYMYDGRGVLEEVVETMKEMDWLYKHTNYAERLRDACDQIVFNIHDTHGWLEQEEFDVVFQHEKDEASRRLRNRFRDQYRKWCAKTGAA
jgi:hypothetical protein